MLDDPQREVLETLRFEYEQRRQEIINLYQRYDKQAQTVSVYLTIVGLLTLGLMALDTKNGTLEMAGVTVRLPSQFLHYAAPFSLVALSIGVLTAFFFIANIMELIHIMHLASARSAALERMINEILGRTILAWDSDLVAEFYSKRWRSGIFVGPSVLVGVWASLIFLLIIGVFSFLCRTLAPGQFWYWAVPVWILAVYHIAEWVWLIRARKQKMETIAFRALQPHSARS